MSDDNNQPKPADTGSEHGASASVGGAEGANKSQEANANQDGLDLANLK